MCDCDKLPQPEKRERAYKKGKIGTVETKFRRRAIRGLATVVAGVGLWLGWPLLVHGMATAILAWQAPRVAKPAPGFTLSDETGAPVSLAAFHGKVVLLNFWATWCGPCQEEIPWFVEFESELQPKGLAVLGVAMDDDGWDVVKPFAAERKINYPLMLTSNYVSRLFDPDGVLPTTLLIDRDGRVRFIHTGLIGKDEYRKEILQLLEAKEGSAI